MLELLCFFQCNNLILFCYMMVLSPLFVIFEPLGVARG